MLKFAFYVSNHGYGHASRISALAETLNRYGVFCHIITQRPGFLFSNLIPGYSTLHSRKIDTGVKHGDNLHTDLEGTISGIIDILSNRNQIVEREVEFVRDNEIDLIIADAPYLVADIAKFSGVPVFTVSNFDWHYIYSSLLHGNPDYRCVLNNIWAMYQSVDYGFRLPFSTNESVMAFPKVQNCGLLARKKDRYNDIRLQLSIKANERILLVMFGGEGSLELDYNKLCQAWSGVVISTQSGITHSNHRQVPENYDFLDLVYNADVVLCKPGYSTFAEATQFGKCVLYCPRGAYPEEVALIAGMKKFNNSHMLPRLDLSYEEWQSVFAQLPIEAKKQRSFANQNEQVAGLIINKYLELRYKTEELLSVFDLGSNSMNYVLYNTKTGKVVHTAHCTTGIGRRLKDRSIPEANLTRAKHAMKHILQTDSYISSMKQAIGTGVFRQIDNQKSTSSWLEKKYSCPFSVISEADEAKYVHYAAIHYADRGEQCVAVDVGGASTEFAFFGNSTKFIWQSIPTGLISILESNIVNNKVTAQSISHSLYNVPARTVDKVIGVGLTCAYLARALYHDSNPSIEFQNNRRIGYASLIEMVESIRSGNGQQYVPFLISAAYLPILELSALYMISILDKFSSTEIVVCSYGIAVGYARSRNIRAKKRGRNS